MPRDGYPWWFVYTFDNRLRRYLQDPRRILSRWLEPGMRVLDIGCGMGFFAIAAAELVGPEGRVTAVDVEPALLEVVRRRACRAGVEDRIKCHLSAAEDLDLRGTFDFALASWSLHETTDMGQAAERIAAHLKDGGRLLVTEPKLHVSPMRFRRIVEALEEQDLAHGGDTSVPLSHAALLEP
jgi:ubiquinone/menaquinone biosynthesis C-methylase UbiE